MVRGSQAPDRSPTVMPLIFAGSGFSCRAHLTGLHAYGYARISTGITRQCSTPLPPPLPAQCLRMRATASPATSEMALGDEHATLEVCTRPRKLEAEATAPRVNWGPRHSKHIDGSVLVWIERVRCQGETRELKPGRNRTAGERPGA